jgi:hypothetical protein
MQTKFVEWRASISLMFIEMNQCIVKKQIRQVVVLKTDANTFGECPSMSLKFIKKE